jgi:SAM-dependent methyltransferase
MQSQKNDLLVDISRYFTSKLHEYGETPRGVDWNGEEAQVARFKELCRIIETPDPFSVNDLGCGYGALYDFLSLAYGTFSYTGIDISESMVSAAKHRYQGHPNAGFTVGSEPLRMADYGMASGIFNIHFNRGDEQWFRYIATTLDVLNETSLRGFAFNCLTTYSDAEKMRSDLYYADPYRLFDLCKRRYSRNVALLHDYGLFEFTVLVRK